MSLIKKSKHFVYIENQYFISATPSEAAQNELSIHAANNEIYPDSCTPVIARNRIAWALYLRISDAIRQASTYRAIIICPLFADMHGSVLSNVALRTVAHNVLTTFRWLFNSLQAAHPNADINHYLSIHCLHKYQVLPSGAVLHGEIYVHSKVMIVDDRTIVIGSANINDRSMAGTRDSETALVIEDHSYVKSTMNGESYHAGANAHSFRLRLWLEHLGYLGDDACDTFPILQFDSSGPKIAPHVISLLQDPVHDNTFLHTWKHFSTINTMAYTATFASFPSSNIRSLSKLEECLQHDEEGVVADKTKRSETIRALQVVQGHLVDYPMEFLIDSDLSPPLVSPEGLLPSYVFL